MDEADDPVGDARSTLATVVTEPTVTQWHWVDSVSSATSSPSNLGMWHTMGAIEHDDLTGSGVLDELPEFELTYRFDDEANPQEVTLFVDGDDDLATRWLTIDRGHAVALESIQ